MRDLVSDNRLGGTKELKTKKKMEKPKGYKLCEHLREVAADTANPERAQAMLWAADEIEALIEENRKLKGNNLS